LKLGIISKAVLALMILIGVFWACFQISPAKRFTRKSAAYYQNFSAACDALLHKFPVGTNFSDSAIKEDPSIPEILRQLNPSLISVQSNGVFIIAGLGHLGGVWYRLACIRT
jgi:hypothetical protein